MDFLLVVIALFSAMLQMFKVKGQSHSVM